MKRRACILLATLSAQAIADWDFGEAVTVSRAHGPKIFHHVESAGRKSVAAGDGTVAVVWEDNRSGVPLVYAAFKLRDETGFGHERQLSRTEAYEPAVVSAGNGQFIFVWEEAGRVWLRAGAPSGLREAVVLAKGSSQVTVSAEEGLIWAAWVHQTARGKRVAAANVRLGQNGALVVSPPQVVDASPESGDQYYPAIAVSKNGGAIVAWEDRRAGHTRIYSAFAPPGKAFGLSSPLNEVARSQAIYGRGPGAARAVLTRYRAGVAAAWMDKRDFRSGYDVYAAIDARGVGQFGPNQKVQDAFGEGISQWHAALAGDSSTLVAVWDDNRDETADIFLSSLETDGWSENLAVPGASGDGEQREPSIAVDSDGNFHLVWVEQLGAPATTAIRYTSFRRMR